MAKKYLLYIHDDEKFDAVEEKSGLVNYLLDLYWSERYIKNDFCKNGHIARNGKCTWKGCKYSG